MKWKGNTTNEKFLVAVKIILGNELQHVINILENKNNVMLISNFFFYFGNQKRRRRIKPKVSIRKERTQRRSQ